MKTVKLTFKTNEEWRKERANSIGASAVGILIGENHFTTPYELAQRIRAERNGEFDFSQSLAMMRGHAYEQGVADLFAWQTGKQIIKSSSAEYLLRREDIPFMHASPDRTYWIDENGMKHGKNAEANKGILECKTTRRPIDPEDLPVSWIFQLQVQLGISGFKEGYIAWDVLTSADGFGYRRFEFNEEIFNAAVEVCREFWQNCILDGNNPAPVNASDVVALYPNSIQGKTITANAETIKDLEQLKEIKQTKKELEEEIEQLSDKIKSQFTDEEAMVSPDGKVLATFKTTAGRTSVDSKKLKAEYPEIYANCSKVSAGSRTFLLK
jgi:predicted phage-related endonuclease